jgi:rSAM/selenodomain-associated transferase 2
MLISVIVPVLDEAAALPATLAHLAHAIARHPDAEVIAVDGGSHDATQTLLAAAPWVRRVDAPRGRACQQNAGAAVAQGQVLLFLHADTWLPPEALQSVAAAARAQAFHYGGFRHRFSGEDWRLRAISALHNFRCRKASTFYGDQALFVRRTTFMRLGGFPEQVAEDIALCEKLKAVAIPVFLADTVVTSSRKFERMGVWRSLGRVLAILLCLRFGRPPPRTFFADVR